MDHESTGLGDQSHEFLQHIEKYLSFDEIASDPHNMCSELHLSERQRDRDDGAVEHAGHRLVTARNLRVTDSVPPDVTGTHAPCGATPRRSTQLRRWSTR